MITLHNTHQPITDNDSLDGETGSNDGDYVKSDMVLPVFMIDCPVCLEKQKNYVTLTCGHKICNHCELLLIQHNRYDVCPECRTPIYHDIENSNYLNLTDETPREMLESISEFNNVRYDNQIITDFQQLIDDRTGEAVVQITTRDNDGRIRIINRRLVDHIDVIEPERRIVRQNRRRYSCCRRTMNVSILLMVFAFFFFVMFGEQFSN
tara:strand:- start:868 stop:1491 length:624 start_codon:yes stop_codon:yes gene_type:complete